MLFQKLCDYYGMADRETEQYITGFENKLTESQQEEAYTQIIQKRTRRYGFPDIAFLSGILQEKAKDNSGMKFYWSVCNDCRSEFSYSFHTCPVCFLQGKTSSGYKVKTSEYQPPKKVIRWNLPLLKRSTPEEKVCADCACRDEGYCLHFGDPDYQCSRSDFEYCTCKSCCAKYRKANNTLRREK